MLEGKVEAIYIAPERGEPIIGVDQAYLVPGLGIQGDRYCVHQGETSKENRPDRQLTLIESEAIEAINQDAGIQISPPDTRRNIITRGIRLNELVGRVFFVGTAQIHGIRLCEPCDYLASRTDKRILTAMAHRGGLRAEILSEGIIHQNDAITVPDE